MEQDQKGFYHPNIDNEKCINCHKCENICPANQLFLAKPDQQTTFACQSIDPQTRKNSSSGGFFTHIAQHILDKDGIVFGAAFTPDWQIAHSHIDKTKDIPRFQGSKYLQSNIGDCLKQVKTFLTQGKPVLFSGTPCQIAGLNNFLSATNTNTKNLLTIDLVCHGVPANKIYQQYLDHIQTQHNDTITKINFRHKPNGWKKFGMHITFHQTTPYFKDITNDPFIIGFLKNYYLSDACYTCKYANTDRQGDMTIADFWGYQNTPELPDDNTGITLVITNNQKGLSAFKKTLPALNYTEKTYNEAAAGNRALNKSASKNRRYDEFWQDWQTYNFEELKEKYFQAKN